MGMRRPHSELHCHLVWATWDRLPLIRPEVEIRLFGAVRAKLEELGCSEVTVGGVADHIHVVCRFPPALAIAYLVQQVNGASSHMMTHEAGGPLEFKWQGGYGAFTLGRGDLARARR